MTRLTCAALCTLAIAALAAGCPDPCAFLGAGCNESSDCGFGELCRKSRDFEGAGCAVLAGRCISDNDDDQTCGSVDDCDEGECCDPETNLCIGEVGFTNVDCDENTCGDCDETSFGDRCELSTDCRDNETCSAADINAFDTIEERGVCRRSCTGDEGCPGDQRCDSGLCTVPIGTPCFLPLDVDSTGGNDQCLGLNCTRLDFAGDRGDDDGYCTAFCSEPTDCPAGFGCSDFECRKP